MPTRSPLEKRGVNRKRTGKEKASRRGIRDRSACSALDDGGKTTAMTKRRRRRRWRPEGHRYKGDGKCAGLETRHYIGNAKRRSRLEAGATRSKSAEPDGNPALPGWAGCTEVAGWRAVAFPRGNLAIQRSAKIWKCTRRLGACTLCAKVWAGWKLTKYASSLTLCRSTDNRVLAEESVESEAGEEW